MSDTEITLPRLVKAWNKINHENAILRTVAEDAIEMLENPIYGKHTCDGMTCSLCDKIKWLREKLK